MQFIKKSNCQIIKIKLGLKQRKTIILSSENIKKF